MPKHALNIGDLSNEESKTTTYVGPTPPAGTYRVKAVRWTIGLNSKNDPMFKIIFEIDEPKGSPKAKYNGYGIFHNANLTKQGAPYVNQMLDGLGIPRRSLWNDGYVTDPKDDEVVVKIGGTKVDGLGAMVSAKLREYPAGSGDYNLNIRGFAKLDLTEQDDEDADDMSDEAPVDMDDDAPENDGEDVEPEPEPAPKPKGAAKKAAANRRKPKPAPEPEPEPEVEDDEELWEDNDEDDETY